MKDRQAENERQTDRRKQRETKKQRKREKEERARERQRKTERDRHRERMFLATPTLTPLTCCTKGTASDSIGSIIARASCEIKSHEIM